MRTHTPAVESWGVYWIVCVLYLDKETGERECEEKKDEEATKEDKERGMRAETERGENRGRRGIKGRWKTKERGGGINRKIQ